MAPQDLPVGILTSVIGGVYLLAALYRRSRLEQGTGMSTSHCAAALPQTWPPRPARQSPCPWALPCRHPRRMPGRSATGLEARDLTLAYGRREVVRAVSLTGRAGSGGRWSGSGAGKSSC